MSLSKQRGFTLVELLVVIGIIFLMMGLAAPTLTGTSGGRSVTNAAYSLADLLEQARTYAIANNTYVWVGFFEEDGSKTSATQNATPGTGRVIVTVVASLDGSRYNDALMDASTPPAFGTEPATVSPSRNQVKLVALNKPLKLDNMHLGSSVGGMPSRPIVQPDYQVGNLAFSKRLSSGNQVQNPTTFTLPLATAGTAQTPQYTFTKIIEFNNRGEASKIGENTFSGPGLQSEMEIALQPTHANVIDPQYSSQPAAAIQIEGLSGRVKVFRP